MGHACLVAQEGRQMHWFGCIILGECLALAPDPLAPLLGEEGQGPVTGCREFTVRLKQTQSTFNPLLI